MELNKLIFRFNNLVAKLASPMFVQPRPRRRRLLCRCDITTLRMSWRLVGRHNFWIRGACTQKRTNIGIIFYKATNPRYNQIRQEMSLYTTCHNIKGESKNILFGSETKTKKSQVTLQLNYVSVYPLHTPIEITFVKKNTKSLNKLASFVTFLCWMTFDLRTVCVNSGSCRHIP